MDTFNRDDYLRNFGERVKQIRTAKGMSQDELAIKSGYTSRSTISKIEHGRADVPRSQIVLIAQALGVSPMELTLVEEPTAKEIALARQIMRLDAYRRALIDSILNTEPETIKKDTKGADQSAPMVQRLLVHKKENHNG